MANIANARQLGVAVRAERKRLELSQQALAERAKVSRAWLARFENGHPSASIEQIFRVLRTLDLALAIGPRTYSPAETQVLAALAARDKRG